MAKAPDWLMNMTNSAPNLVEDSPQFRAAENEQQLQNINKASEEAMREVQKQTNAMAQDTVRSQLQALQSITPRPTPLAGPDQQFFEPVGPEVSTPMSPNVPGPSDFAPSDTPQPLAGPPEAPQQDPMEVDPASEIEQISQATGIPPQVIAQMSLLGQDIEKNERMGGGMPPPTEAQPPSPPTPAPLMAPPPQQPPPTQPQMTPQI